VDLGSDTILCGNNLNFILDAGPGDDFTWSTGGNAQTQPVSSTGYYVVTVENHNIANTITCLDNDTIFVKVLAQPTVVDLGPDTCSTVAFDLDAENGGGVFQYNWSTGATSQTINVSNSGTYSVTVAEEFGYNCETTDSKVVTIIPEPVITIGPDTALCSFNHMMMTVKDQDGFLDQFPYTYLWSTVPVTPLNGQTTRIVDFGCITPGFDYTVSVAVSGCTTVNDDRIITAKNCELEVYNIITPNGDGCNDVFCVTGIENFPNSTLQVYNRWGKKVYQNDNYQTYKANPSCDCLNGTNSCEIKNFETGFPDKNYADGVYFYVLTVNYGESLECVEVINYQGTITIIR